MTSFQINICSNALLFLQKQSSIPLTLLVDKSGSGGGLVLPGRRQNTNRLVVSGKSVDSGLDENESELGVGILSVLIEVLSDGNSLLDKVVKILRNLGGKASLSAWVQKIIVFFFKLTNQRFWLPVRV